MLYFFYIKFLYYYYFVIGLIGIVLGLVHFLLLLFCSLVNPGIPNRNLSDFSNEYIGDIYDNNHLFCKKCQVIKFPKNHIFHCNFCDFCVENFDGHSFWIGKCIGKHNSLAFEYLINLSYIYFGYTILICIFLPFTL